MPPGAVSPCPVAEHEQRKLWTLETLFDDDSAAGIPERFSGELGSDVATGGIEIRGDEDSLARGEAVGLYDVTTRKASPRKRSAEPWSSKTPKAAVGTDAELAKLLHERLRALEPGAVGAGPKDQLATRPQSIGEPVDKGCLGTDHEEIGVKFLCRSRDRCDRVALGRDAADPGISRRGDDVDALAERERERVLSGA